MTNDHPAPGPLYVLRWQQGRHLHAVLYRCGVSARNDWVNLLFFTVTATLTVVKTDGTATQLSASYLE